MTGVVELSPFLPMAVIIVFTSTCLVLSAIIVLRSDLGAFWRILATLAITVMLLNPKIVDEEREQRKELRV